MSREPVLVARELWAAPPEAPAAVRGVSLELGRGEWVALAGPNGCGKSTLALALAGLWPASRGTVTWRGAALAPTAAGRAAARVATVLQEPSSQLFERTVADEIAFAARNLGAGAAECDAAVREWAARFALEPLLDRDPHTLSAGMQQRVLLAGALAARPSALVADEATAHMDAAGREQALAVVRDAVSRGLAVLWVTQDALELRAVDRVVSMSADGAIAAAEPPASVPSPPARATGPVSPVVLRVRIDPPAPDAQGPVIRIDEPLEFELRAGAPVALVGPNGTGKTVALEAIAGVRPHPQVHVSGGPDRPTPVLAAQYPDLQVFGNTVAEEIGWAAAERGRAAGVSQAMALELFAELSLGPQILDRSTWALSAGQRRLVQVVAALVTPASLVVVDEPTCGLDPARATGLGQLMGRAAQLIPLLVATQDEPFSGRIRASLRGLGRVVGNAASTYGKTD